MTTLHKLTTLSFQPVGKLDGHPLPCLSQLKIAITVKHCDIFLLHLSSFIRAYFQCVITYLAT